MDIIRARTSTGGGGSGLPVNAVETLTGNKTITSPGVYFLDPDGVDRDVRINLSAAGTVVVKNVGTWNTDTKLNTLFGAADVTVYDEIYSGRSIDYVFDGTNYYAGIAEGYDPNSVLYNIAIGHDAQAYDAGVAVGWETNGRSQGVAIGNSADANQRGVAVGNNANAPSDGVAVGRNAQGNSFGTSIGGDSSGDNSAVAVGYGAAAADEGVAVGRAADAAADGIAVGMDAEAGVSSVAVGRTAIADGVYSVAIGPSTDDNTKDYAAALGYGSKITWPGELALAAKNDANGNHMASIVKWSDTVAGGATDQEIFLMDYGTNRLVIPENTALGFTIHITAYEGTTEDGAYWIVKGLIRRNGTNSTVLVASNKEAVAKDEAAWDVTVSADNVNEALIIEVTLDDTNATKVTAVGYITRVTA